MPFLLLAAVLAVADASPRSQELLPGSWEGAIDLPTGLAMTVV